MNNVWDVAPRTERGDAAAAGQATGPATGPAPDSAQAPALPGAEAGSDAKADPKVEAGVEAGAEFADAEPTPLGLDAPEPCGDASVDRAVRRLTQVDVLSTELHGEVYEDVHRELREALAGLDR
ncbi:hypothetical protein OG216_12690 [Streptomycetaceae bacterium NBC_01309]